LDVDDPDALEVTYLKDELTPDQQDTVRIGIASDKTIWGAQGISPQALGILRATDDSWIVYEKDKASLVNSQLFTSQAAANAQISKWMTEGGHTGENRWESYPSLEEGEGKYYRVREKPDVAGRIDPNNPIRQTIDIGNGQSLYVLSNGQTITGPTQEDMDWSGWDPADNIKEIFGRQFAILPGEDTPQPVSDRKFVSGDISVINRYDLTDGSEVLVFSDGTKLNSQPGKALATVTDDPSGYIRITDTEGNIQLKEPLTPTGIEYTAAGFNIAGTDIQDLGLPEKPATVETIGGAPYIRGTTGGLTAMTGVLDRMIEHALVTGDVDKAIAWDDFRKRPSSLEVLEKAMEWATTPGDQQFISALHHASSAGVAGMPGGLGPTPEDIAAGNQFAQVAAPPAFAQDAYQRFQDSITGGQMPTSDEFAAAIAREAEPPPPTVREQLELDILNAQLAEAEADTIRKDAESDAKLAKSGAEAKAILLKANAEAERLLEKSRADIARAEKELDFKMQPETGLPIADGTETAATDGTETAATDGATKLSDADKAIITGVTTDAEKFAERGPDAITIEKLNTLLANLSPEQKAHINDVYGGINQLSNASGDSMLAMLATLNSSFEGAGLARITGTGKEEPRFLWDREGNKVQVPGELAQGYLDSGTWYKSLEAWQEANPDAAASDTVITDDDQVGTVNANAAVTEVTDTGAVIGTTAGNQQYTQQQFDLAEARGQTIEELFGETGPAIDPAGFESFDPQYTERAETGDSTLPLPLPLDPAGFESFEPQYPDDMKAAATSGGSTLPLTLDPAGFESFEPAGFQGDPAVPVAARDYTRIPGPTGADVSSAIGGGISDLFTTSPARDDPYAHIKALGSAANAVRGFFAKSAIGDIRQEREREETRAFEGFEGFARGGRTNDNTAIVGESGPELALFPNGTEIIPLDRRMKPAQARRLRRRGIRGMQEGGLVFPEQGQPGLGLSRALSGQAVGPSQGRIFRKAGFTTPSAQALRNLLPEELEQFRAMGARARIPEATFERELAQGIPSGERRTGSARFLPLSLRS
jgi:hypothetical protein